MGAEPGFGGVAPVADCSPPQMRNRSAAAEMRFDCGAILVVTTSYPRTGLAQHRFAGGQFGEVISE
ncbi:hypothetical protein [Nocardia sp. NPDC060249]|uniref:hypothetical protein n=1 Tax=Nocardia sp. NPDC060249 TaxID=3347082 RepID=UPI00365AF1B2